MASMARMAMSPRLSLTFTEWEEESSTACGLQQREIVTERRPLSVTPVSECLGVSEPEAGGGREVATEVLFNLYRVRWQCLLGLCSICDQVVRSLSLMEPFSYST